MNIDYLATPYSDPDPLVREVRYKAACHITLRLMRQGFIVFSPILHNHFLEKEHGLPSGWDFWQKYDLAMLKRCNRLIVGCIQGWKESIGVAKEVEEARSRRIPILYVEGGDKVGYNIIQKTKSAKGNG